MRKNDTGWCDYVSVTRIKDHIKDLLIFIPYGLNNKIAIFCFKSGFMIADFWVS